MFFEALWLLGWTFALAYLLMAIAGWYVIGRDVPAVWVILGMLVGVGVAGALPLHSGTWFPFVELRHFVGAGVGGILAALAYVLARRGGVTS